MDDSGDSNYTAKVADFGLSRQADNDFYRMSAQSKVPIRWTGTVC